MNSKQTFNSECCLTVSHRASLPIAARVRVRDARALPAVLAKRNRPGTNHAHQMHNPYAGRDRTLACPQVACRTGHGCRTGKKMGHHGLTLVPDCTPDQCYDDLRSHIPHRSPYARLPGDPGRIRTCNLPLRRESFIFLILLCFLVLGGIGRGRLYIVCTKPRPDLGLVRLCVGVDAHGQSGV